MYSAQIFLGSNLSLKRTSLLDNDIQNANKLFSNWDINLYTHIPYVVNLSGKAGLIAYLNDEKSTEHAIASIKSIQHELDTLHKCNCKNKGCVVHIGSVCNNKNEKDGLDAVVKSISQLKLYSDTPLCLETMVGTGGVLGKNIEQLEYIYNNIKYDKEGVGFCLDTCHLFAEGTYDLSKCEEVDKLFKDYVSTFGLDKIKVIHFNDSKDMFGSKKDRHACIGHGEMWPMKNNKLHDSCRYFLDKAKKENIPIILETEPEDYKKVIQMYHN
jgi:apurinic endonuclease APN1